MMMKRLGTLFLPLVVIKKCGYLQKMVQSVDDDEKHIGTMFLSGQNRETWLLTENAFSYYYTI